MDFTKGEWKVDKAPTCHYVVADVDISSEVDKGYIAEVYSCFTGTHEANAHLIAASPRLYEWIKGKADEGDNDAKCFLITLGFE